ncbi:hypothetical protein PhCBS80983_g05682 [Powellomyces hirtus]|uniref:F-box domain-containing protein n=1 Tax=Powellomyces hirtus TaxID=109895 RepID=A0A507DVF9_9FUNG|nr:hypothetical protein PhCBS80983_g05682 [Powellomyces hirtus]
MSLQSLQEKDRRKRPRINHSPPGRSTQSLIGQQRINFAGVLSDEVILYILTYLSYQDLARLSRASWQWKRLASDQALWKTLFVGRFPLRSPIETEPAHSTAKGKHGGTGPGRRRSGLAGDIMREQCDWLSMYILQHNWNAGNYRITNIDLSGADPPADPASERQPTTSHSDMPTMCTPIVAFTTDYVLVAPKHDHSKDIGVQVWSIDQQRHIGTLRRTAEETAAITSLRVDGSAARTSKRVIAGYSNGDCTIWEISGDAGRWSSDELCTISGRPGARTLLGVAICDDVITTCSSQFDVVLYRLLPPSHTDRKWTWKLLNRLQSRVCWAPVDLHLLRGRTLDTYLLHISYASPTPSLEWQVGLERVTFSLTRGIISNEHFSPKPAKFMARSVSPLTCIKFRPPYLVTAHADNVVQVYNLIPTPTARNASRTTLVHLSPLYAHAAAVTALELDGDSGKLVTGGFDGIKVWELQDESGRIVVRDPTTTLVDADWQGDWERRGHTSNAERGPKWLGFDAGRIVSFSGCHCSKSARSASDGADSSCSPADVATGVVKIFSFLDE